MLNTPKCQGLFIAIKKNGEKQLRLCVLLIGFRALCYANECMTMQISA